MSRFVSTLQAVVGPPTPSNGSDEDPPTSQRFPLSLVAMSMEKFVVSSTAPLHLCNPDEDRRRHNAPS